MPDSLPTSSSSQSKQIADGHNWEGPLTFGMRALPGYVNRWIECEAVMLRLLETGEAELVIRRGGGFPDLPATDDTVHAP